MKETPFIDVADTPTGQLLQKVSFFAHLPQKHIEAIIRMSRLRQYAAHETIIPEGAYDTYIYVLLAGTVEVVKKQTPIAVLHQTGDLFGELAVLTCDSRSASVVAISTTSCLAVDASFLDHLDPANRDAIAAIIYKMMAEIVSNRLRATSNELAAANGEIVRLRAELASK
ncbi:MAG TPA: cyclic nucleotide-binding domain-containing protein [Candidatus Methylacidiphilales bacterium]